MSEIIVIFFVSVAFLLLSWNTMGLWNQRILGIVGGASSLELTTRGQIIQMEYIYGRHLIQTAA